MQSFTTKLIALSLLAASGGMLLAAAGCTNSGDPGSSTAAEVPPGSTTDSHAAPAAPQQPDRPASAAQPKPAKLQHLAAFFDAEPSLVGEVSFKVTQEKGEVTREFEVEIEGGTPGDALAVLLNGENLGEIRIDLSGEGELELDQHTFPEGFRDPEPGATVKLGERITVELAPLETVTHLTGAFEDANGAVGEVSYKVEELVGQTFKEFKLQIEGGEANREFDVTIDGVGVGKLALDEDGEGDLRFGRRELEFPANFPEPKPGSLVKIGQQFTLKLDNAL